MAAKRAPAPAAAPAPRRYTGLDALPVSINLWRSLTIWMGGMGIIVLFTPAFWRK